MNRVTPEGLELIRQFEGFRPTPYLDPAGIPTIGFGHAILPGESFSEITEAQADDLLMADIEEKEGWIAHYIHRPLNDNQYSALMSLVFNLGVTPLTMTLGMKLNAGDLAGCAAQFGRWVYASVDGREEILPGLVARRAAEMALFLKPAA